MIITYFFAVLPKLSIFICFLHVFIFCIHPRFMLLNYSVFFKFVFNFCAILSIIIGSLGAMYQVKIKRLLAFSAIANMGYIILGISCGSYLGFFSSVYAFIIYVFGLIQIFSILLVLRHFSTYLKLKNVVELMSLSSSNTLLGFFLALGFLSLAGVPPLAGFFGKVFIFYSLVMEGHYFLVLISLFFSVLISVYYIRLVRFL